MEIIIEIPESVKQAFDKATEDDIYGCYYDYNSIIGRAIKNGVPTEPCDDAISRQAVFDLVRGLKRWCVRSEDGKFNNVGLLYDDVMFGLDRLPPVTPKQKMGRWIKISPAGIYECSECGQNVMTGDIDAYRHCHGCGAKMAESEET